jgi:hypothetical protein
VKLIEQVVQSASTPKTGLRAPLGGLLRVRGSGAPSSNTHRTFLVTLVTLGATLLALVCSATPASALESRFLQESFGPDGTSATHFQRPAPLAIDQVTGSLYLGEVQFGQSVEKFNASHEPEPFSGIAPNIVNGKLTGLGNFFKLAVDSGSHDLFVATPSALRAFQSDGEPADFTAGAGKGTNEIVGSEICGVAVNVEGDIYLSEFSSGVHIFKPSGEPLAVLPTDGLCELGVDSHGTVYATVTESAGPGLSGPVQKFAASEQVVTAATTYEAKGAVDKTPAAAIAVDSTSDHLFVDEGTQIAEYDENGVRLGAFGGTEPGALPATQGRGAGVAVNDVTGHIYVAQGDFEGQAHMFGPTVLLPDVETGEATEIKPKGAATLNGKVKPDGVALTECQFEYVDAEHYEPSASDPYAAGTTAPCVPAVGAIPTSGETEVHAAVSGLEAGVTYHFRLKAANTEGPNFGVDQSFSTPPRPAITAATIANLTANSVDLNAQVNPGGVEVTDCHFDYGESSEYEHTGLPCEQAVGAGTGDVLVARHLTGLQADKTYHWRLVATSEVGTTIGVDHTFIYDTTGEALPDNRAYEMVTPPHKNAAFIGQGVGPEVAEDGSHLILPSIQCFAGSESCTAYRLYDEPYLFSRTSAGWTTTPLAPPARQFSASTMALTWAETGATLFSIPNSTTLEDDLYLRRPTDGSFVDLGPETPPSAGSHPVPWLYGQLKATSDFSRVLLVEPSAWPSFDETGGGGYSTYEFADGNPEPRLVGVSGGPGSTDLISKCQTTPGGSPSVENPGALSADGETVYFTATKCPEGSTGSVPASEVFARIGERETIPISEPSAFSDAAPYPGCTQEPCIKTVNTKEQWSDAGFAGASNDGKQAFFTSNQRLTDDAGPVGNLYEYDFKDSAAEGRLVDVSAGDTSGQGPRVQGVVAISSDGSHIYFVAHGVLTPSANTQGVSAKDGANNLYVFTHEAGHSADRVAFIAQLPQTNGSLWSESNGGSANVTPDGRFLVFESRGRLTSDDTRTDGARQIFRYDAQTGQLLRISIGEHGFNDNGNGGIPDPNSEDSEGPGDAEIVLPLHGQPSAGPRRSDPTMSHDGSYIFFTSALGLTPHALNDVQIGTRQFGSGATYAENVYEWHEGAVHLISDGRDTARLSDSEESAVNLIGADATGANVFFTTTDPLVPADTDTQVDYYDARICTAAEPCITAAPTPLPPCLGEACHGIPPSRSPSAAGPTATFSGAGNVSPVSMPAVKAKSKSVKCKRGLVRNKKGKCVKKPKKQAKQAKKSSHDRRVK